MKALFKLLGRIALITLIAFSMAACDNGTTDLDGGSNPGNQEGYKTYTAYDEAGNAFILIVTKNDTYVLSILNPSGSTLGTSTGTITSSNNTSITCKHKGGNIFIVTINSNIIVSVNDPVPLDSGGTKSPQGLLSPYKPSNNGNETATYTITFSANGATGTAPAIQTVRANAIVTLPSGNGLSKTGFTFGGWNTNTYGTGTTYDAYSSYTVTGNVTLYAKWDAERINVSGTYIYVNNEMYNVMYYITINNDGTFIMVGDYTITGMYKVAGNILYVEDRYGRTDSIYILDEDTLIVAAQFFVKDGGRIGGATLSGTYTSFGMNLKLVFKDDNSLEAINTDYSITIGFGNYKVSGNKVTVGLVSLGGSGITTFTIEDSSTLRDAKGYLWTKE